ncbi:hypothetical protein ACFYN3_35565 [Streptomyces lavendulae]|uniref:hypothetical protein n=1 Tax=Streptomyces lavendulae TaxID=1914 RepID=UPI0033DF1B01
MEKSPAALAGEVAQAIRNLNHATLNAKTLAAPEISSTVQELLLAVDRLPQALYQLSARLVREQQAARLRMGDSRDPDRSVVEVETYLADAEADLGDVAEHLRKAGALLSAMSTPRVVDLEDQEQREEEAAAPNIWYSSNDGHPYFFRLDRTEERDGKKVYVGRQRVGRNKVESEREVVYDAANFNRSGWKPYAKPVPGWTPGHPQENA